MQCVCVCRVIIDSRTCFSFMQFSVPQCFLSWLHPFQIDPDGLLEDRQEIIRLKLSVTGFHQKSLPHPHSVSCANNLSIIPNVSIFDVYNYLLTFPEIYSHSKLKEYKKLEGYTLFLDGYVLDLSCGQFSPPFTNYFTVHSKVKPKTRERDPITRLPFYKCWIILTKNKDSCCVKSAFCCCKGG